MAFASSSKALASALSETVPVNATLDGSGATPADSRRNFENVSFRLDAVLSRARQLAVSLPCTISFVWEELHFTARIQSPDAQNAALLEISCRLGLLPFTAEDGAARSHVLNFLEKHTTPVTGQYNLDSRGNLNFMQRTVLTDFNSPATIIQSVILCLAQAQPYLKTIKGVLFPPAQTATLQTVNA